MRLTVRGLLAFLFVMIAGMWLGLRVYQTKSLDEIQQSVDVLSSEAARDVEDADDLGTTIEGYHALWKTCWQNPKPGERRDLEIDRRRFVDLLSKINPVKLPGNEPDLDFLSKLYFEATRNALEEGMVTESQKTRIEQLYQQIVKEAAGIQEIYETAQKKIEDQGAFLVKSQRHKDLAFLGVSLGGLAVLTAAIWLLLGAPLTELARGMRHLPQEDWNQTLAVRGFGEIAALIRSFNDMAATIKRQKDLLITEATTDELTGLLNFRAFQDRVQEELERAKRLNEPLSLILADIDYFKKFNDAHGHLAGNEALKEIASLIRKGSRRYDLVARFGGEEFAVVMPETDAVQAGIVAGRIQRRAVANSFNLTISCGVATYPAEAANLSELIAKADQKLYRAKAEGRNRVVA
jgi:diguanylate cyclase (GGDEF)-like protein